MIAAEVRGVVVRRATTKRLYSGQPTCTMTVKSVQWLGERERVTWCTLVSSQPALIDDMAAFKVGDSIAVKGAIYVSVWRSSTMADPAASAVVYVSEVLQATARHQQSTAQAINSRRPAPTRSTA